MEAITETLRFVATIPGAETVFDYSEPADHYAPEARAAFEERRRRVAAAGEPWISHFSPSDMDRLLRNAGFGRIKDLDRLDIVARFSPSGDRDPGASRTGAHVVHAVGT
jgi:O-methyltransferase involved in polyketide biosynthesis